jgi:dTDP-glucose 4,6-dehydratase
MKNIMVTGGCGFIGSNFIRYLLTMPNFKKDMRIINLDKLTYAGNQESLVDVSGAFNGQYIFVHADICDRQAMEKVFDEFEIDTVCHFAAESHVDRSIVEPDAFVQTNIMGTFNLLNLFRARKDRMFLFHHVSTDEVFGSLGKYGHFTETTPYNPSSPYSASKASSDHLVRAFIHTYAIPATISNCSNNYGPYQYPEKLIPLMILNAFEGKELPVYGKGFNIRDWLYVKDHCRGIWEIMNRGKRGETYNIGGDCEKPNIDVVCMICDILDEMEPLKNGRPRRELIEFVDDKKLRPGHDFRYAIDFSKIQVELGWAPEESFKTGLEKTIQWYLDHPNWVSLVQKKCGEWLRRHYKGEEPPRWNNVN